MNTGFQTLPNENAGAENDQMTTSDYLLFDKFKKVSHAENEQMTSPSPSKDKVI